MTEPDWTEHDRALVLALLAEHNDTCASCGHPKALCRDPKTAGTWQVVREICQPSRVAQAVQDNDADSKRSQRGLQIVTRRTASGG